ncbi:unnamed protein product [Pseudo-nitzschia multistriata]|uniref:Uncharacterized protein n=1 Tax=Pseudo-nitzschia multistriata TaxID=183589 RepID=A0A448ZCN1_9STRA|nr:unnamed protein product [Pseudo-nitzschia multistriata]
MALTLLNHFYWQIPEAKVPFMIADVVIVVAMRYVDKALTAERELQEIQQQQAQKTQKMNKEEKLAQKQEARHQQHKMAHTSKHGGGNGGAGKKQNFNIKSD